MVNVANNVKFAKITVTVLLLLLQKLSHTVFMTNLLTHSSSMFPSYDSQLIGLLWKSTDWFPYNGNIDLKGFIKTSFRLIENHILKFDNNNSVKIVIVSLITKKIIFVRMKLK